MRNLRVMGYVLASVLAASTAQAALLNLPFKYPMVEASYLSASYDADNISTTTGRLAVSGFTGQYVATSSSTPQTLSPFGTFEARINIVAASGVATGGRLYVTGNVDGVPGNELLYQSSTLLRFGSGADDKFEVVFREDTTTALAAAGSEVSIIMEAQHIPLFPNTVDPTYTVDFASNGLGLDKADMYASSVPEPATLMLLASGAIAGMSYIRRRLS